MTITLEVNNARALAGSVRAAVGDAVVGISFGSECPPDACFAPFVARRWIDGY